MVHPPFAVVNTTGVRTVALVHSPAAFLRHGVLMMPEDLERVTGVLDQEALDRSNDLWPIERLSTSRDLGP
ncbi:hypothetical protein BH24ACT15_BH24ACT15_25600 [soil metagenome]|jgi:hypothetical protein